MIVQALLSGEQIADLRKGGLREDGRHFAVQSKRFWLYPTFEHQQTGLLKPAYRSWVERSAAKAPADRSIVVEGWADVVGVAELREPAHLEAIGSKFIWTLGYAASRLKWKRRDPLSLLVLRGRRLLEPITVPWEDRYGGCTSWVDLGGLPSDPAALPSEPALSDEAFDAKLQSLRSALPVDLAGLS